MDSPLKMLLLVMFFATIVTTAVVFLATSQTQSRANRDEELKAEYLAAVEAVQSGGWEALASLQEVLGRVEQEHPGSPLSERLHEEAGMILLRVGMDQKDWRYFRKSCGYYLEAQRINREREQSNLENAVRYHIGMAKCFRQTGVLTPPGEERTRAYGLAIHHYQEAQKAGAPLFTFDSVEIDLTIHKIRKEMQSGPQVGNGP